MSTPDPKNLTTEEILAEAEALYKELRKPLVRDRGDKSDRLNQLDQELQHRGEASR